MKRFWAVYVVGAVIAYGLANSNVCQFAAELAVRYPRVMANRAEVADTLREGRVIATLVSLTGPVGVAAMTLFIAVNGRHLRLQYRPCDCDEIVRIAKEAR